MSAIRDAVNTLASALTAAGLPTSPEVPEKAAAPFRYIVQREVTAGQTFGSFLLALSVVCVARPGSNATMADAVTDMGLKTLAVVNTLADYQPGSPVLGEPSLFELNGQPTLALAVGVNVRLSRAQMEE